VGERGGTPMGWAQLGTIASPGDSPVARQVEDGVQY